MMTRRQRLTKALTINISSLSFGKLVAIVSGSVVLGGALGGAARYVGHFETKTHAESTFVRRDSMAIYQQGDALIHQRDSLITAAAIAAMQKDLSSLVRACQRKGECP